MYMASSKRRAPKAATVPAPVGVAPPADGAGRMASLGGGGSRGEGTHDYERRRDERIKENRERMQKLGILDLARHVRSSIAGGSPASRRPYKRGATTPSSSRPLVPGLPPRRSSRLQNVSRVSYADLPVKRKDGGPKGDISVLLEGGAEEEVYTDEHEKLLGTCEASWTLYVDGYTEDGVRIYDQVKGRTCHQCRQKTLGHHTRCSKCSIVQGQFCGDCLYMRYGENVLEANKNAGWICPVCRGICNCSICRARKGWAPTGALYNKITRLGFKSVAHYLIQTKRRRVDAEDEGYQSPLRRVRTSVKRSLSFSDNPCPPEVTESDAIDDRQGMSLDSQHINEGASVEEMQSLDGFDNLSTAENPESPMLEQGECHSRLVPSPSSDLSIVRLRNSGELINGGANQSNNYNGKQILLESLDGSELCIGNDKDSQFGGDEEMQKTEDCGSSYASEDTAKPEMEEEDPSAQRLIQSSPAVNAGNCGGEEIEECPDEHVSSIAP